MNTERDDVASKLNIVNTIIRKGYDNTYNSVNDCYKEYCLSIKHSNFFVLKEQLILELSPLLTKF